MQMKMVTDIQIDLYGEIKYYMASAKQGDRATRYIRVQLMNNGNEFQIPDDVHLIANIKKPDGKFCYNECEKQENRVMVQLTNQALAAAGTAYCDIEMRSMDGDLILSSAAFSIEIERSMRNENAIESSNEMTFLDKKVQKYIDRLLATEQQVLETEAAFKIEEEARRNAEDGRLTEEEIRKNNEEERLINERERQRQEELRQQQEENRQEDTSFVLESVREATVEAEKATENCLAVTQRAESALENEEQLKKTLEDAVIIEQNVSQMKSDVESAREQVVKDKEEIEEKIENLSPADIGALGTSGGEMTGELVPSGGIAHVGRDGYIAYPDDGYIDMDGEVTGSLIVTLPITSSIPTMVKFTINVFNYETIESVSYLVSGHVWNGLWYHCTAVCVGNAAGKLSNLTVRFGMKDGRPVIMIGENTTVWNFPIVKIHDILIGFGNLEYSRWCKGWSITIGSISSYTVQGTLNNPHVGYGCVASSCTGNAATADNAAKVGNMPASHLQVSNTIVTRDSNGYTYLNYINCNTSDNENPAISQVIVTNGSDGFFRKASLAHLKAQMGLDAVNNTADSAKSVAYAASAGSAVNDSAGRNIAGTYLPLSGGAMSGNIAWPSGCYISDRNFNDTFAISGNHGNYIMFVDWAAKTPFLGPTWVEDNVGRVDLGRYQYPWKSVYANTFESTSLIKVGSSNISDKTFKLYGDTGPIIKCAYVNDMYISLPYYNTQNAIRFNAYNGNFYMVPEIDNYTYLGSGDRRYAQIYAVNGAIQTSDKREKHDISYIGSDSDYDTFMSDEQLCALIMGILPVVYRRNNGESRRPHHGLISQDFEELMHKIGLADHAGFIKSPKTRDVEVEDKNGEKRINQEIIEGEYTYGFRYEELITDIIRFCQLQQKQLESQAEELRELRTGLQAMEARIKALEA